MAKLPSDKNKVLLIADSLRPSGTTRYISILFRGLLEAGVKPVLVAPEAPHEILFNKEERKHIEVFPGLLGGFGRPFLFKRLKAWAAFRGPVLIHGLSANTASTCQRLARALDIPFVLSVVHIQEKGALRVGDRCTRVLACSEAIRENLINRAKVDKALITVVPLGISVSERDLVDRQIKDRHPTVVTFAKLNARTNLLTFLRAARKVLDVRCGACQFLIVGEGPDEAMLRKQARELKLEKHVVFSHPAVPYEEILADADVYVQTPKQQGFGIFILEAMAKGLPVVASSVGGLIPLVRDGTTGYLVASEDADAGAKRILDLLQDAELNVRMGEAGRQMVADQFPYRLMIDRTMNFYLEVIRSGSSKGLTQILEKS